MKVTRKGHLDLQNQGFTINKKASSADGNLKRRDPQIKTEDLARLKENGSPKVSAFPIEPDTSTWLTRNESADFLRVSVTTIGNYERQGKLHPRFAYRRDSREIEHRVAVYDRDELLKLRRIDRLPASHEPGEVAARCFELFNEGLTIRDVVVEMRKTPDLVRSLYDSWLNNGSKADLLITSTVKEDLERLLGHFSTVTELQQLVEALVSKDKGE